MMLAFPASSATAIRRGGGRLAAPCAALVRFRLLPWVWWEAQRQRPVRRGGSSHKTVEAAIWITPAAERREVMPCAARALGLPHSWRTAGRHANRRRSAVAPRR